MKFHRRIGFPLALLLLVLSCGRTIAAVTTFQWSPAPPTIVTLGQGFSVGVYAVGDTPESIAVTIYRNGVFLADKSPDSGESDVSLSVSTSAATNNTTFTISVYDNSTSQTSTLSAVVNETTPPTVPASLAASSQTATSFTLSWNASTDNVGVTGYEVRNGTTSLGTATGTTRSITALSPGVAYSFTVRARDAFGNWSAWSSALAVTLVDTTAPTAPTSLAISSQTSSTVALSWTGSTDDVAVVAYDVYRTRNGYTALVGSTASGVLTFSDSNVMAATSYTYQVKARDGAGNRSTASNSVNATTSAHTDADGDGVPDGLESVFGIQGNPNPSGETNLNLKTHRPGL